jgi:hypothetical protein
MVGGEPCGNRCCLNCGNALGGTCTWTTTTPTYCANSTIGLCCPSEDPGIPGTQFQYACNSTCCKWGDICCPNIGGGKCCAPDLICNSGSDRGARPCVRCPDDTPVPCHTTCCKQGQDCVPPSEWKDPITGDSILTPAKCRDPLPPQPSHADCCANPNPQGCICTRDAQGNVLGCEENGLNLLCRDNQ